MRHCSSAPRARRPFPPRSLSPQEAFWGARSPACAAPLHLSALRGRPRRGLVGVVRGVRRRGRRVGRPRDAAARARGRARKARFRFASSRGAPQTFVEVGLQYGKPLSTADGDGFTSQSAIVKSANIALRPHLHLLGILQLVWGAVGLLLGVSMLLLAIGGCDRRDVRGGLGCRRGRGRRVRGVCGRAACRGRGECLAGGALRRHHPRGRLAVPGWSTESLRAPVRYGARHLRVLGSPAQRNARGLRRWIPDRWPFFPSATRDSCL